MAEHLGIAIHGAGWVATEHIRAYQAHPNARIVAVSSRTKQGAQRKAKETGLDVAVFDDYDALLAHPGIDAISICTPPAHHHRDTIRAASAGKHVLIEKPVAVTPTELPAMVHAVRAAGVRSVVSFVLRWNPAVRNIKALQDSGALGDTFFVQADYWHNLEQAGLSHKGDPLDVILSGGCHAVDAARYLIGSDVSTVTALSWPESGATRQADTVALLRFANGAMAKVSACTSQWMPYAFNLDVLGTDGAVRGNRLYTKQLPGLTDMAVLPTILPDSGDVTHHPFAEEIDHFIDSILTGVESPVSLANVRNTHEACFAAIESARQNGVPIPLPLSTH